MTPVKAVCAAVFAFSTAAFAQVSITLHVPVSNSTTTTPSLIAASASSSNGISGWAVYFGNTEYYSSSTGLNGTLDQNVTVPAGNYQVTVTAWDNSGAHSSAVVSNVTVKASPLPAPSGSITNYDGLQNAAGNPGTWTNCTASSCSGSGGSNCLGSGVSLGVTTYTLSGAAMKETDDGSSCNILNYRHIGCPADGCESGTHFIDDVWFYLPATNGLQALEWDPDAFESTLEFKMSIQCDSASGLWRFYNTAGKEWTTLDKNGSTIPTYTCSLYNSSTKVWQTGQWHHLQLYGTMDFASNTYTYETFVIDGNTVFENLDNPYNGKSFSASNPTLNIEEQIDNKSTSGATNSVYYDNYNLTVW